MRFRRLAAYEASDVEHVTSAYGAEVCSAEGHHGYSSAFSRYKLDLERILGVPMDNRAHVPLFETEVGERPPK